MNNFAPQHKKKIHNPTKEPHRKKNNKRKKIIIVIGVFLFVVFISAILVAMNYRDAQAAYESAIAGKTEIEKAQKLVEEQKFTEASVALAEAQARFTDAQGHVDSLGELKIIPGVGRQISAVDNILIAGINLSSALGKFVSFGDEILSVIQSDPNITLDQITTEQRRAILKKMYESPPDLQGAKAEVNLAILAMNRIPEYGVLSPIRKASVTIEEQLPVIQKVVDQAVPAVETLPTILGYPEEKTYIFLLQNNTEMRATGGFIGTYGILRLKDGDIVNFTTDNIYNLDNGVKDSLFVQPPWQLTKYMGTTQWFLRDSNWEPDFPTAAQKAEEFYHLENGPEKNIDGVIAVTPTFIQSLLSLTGPITAKGIEFTDENFVATLQKEVEIDFASKGLTDAQRKDVIGELADKLMNTLLSLPKEEWPKLWTTFQKDVEEKQILIYIKDENVQKLIEEQNWAGQIIQTDSDYVGVVDTNLASLKSDPVVKRTINYSVSEDAEKGLIGKLEIHYKHEGTFEWKTTRYRTYTRVYVPKGSELLEYSGVMDNDKLHGGGKGEVEIAEEFGKTRFGGFISIEPNEEGTLTYLYKLPDTLLEQVRNKEYHLYVQKQSGTINHLLNVNFDIGRGIDTFSPLDTSDKEGDNKLRFNTDLTLDREFSIILK